MFEIKPHPTDGTAELIYIPGLSTPVGYTKVHNRSRRLGLSVRVTFLSPEFSEESFYGKAAAHAYIEEVWAGLMAGNTMLTEVA